MRWAGRPDTVEHDKGIEVRVGMGGGGFDTGDWEMATDKRGLPGRPLVRQAPCDLLAFTRGIRKGEWARI